LAHETTKTLAAAGATVVVPARSLTKAQENLAGMANVALAEMDLLNPDSIDAFTETFLASGRPLHLLIHNAGIREWQLIAPHALAQSGKRVMTGRDNRLFVMAVFYRTRTGIPWRDCRSLWQLEHHGPAVPSLGASWGLAGGVRGGARTRLRVGDT
jgi:NAD(P)-dependent dehydrogenase (short-subunit alcohol dehydrogenase family)